MMAWCSSKVSDATFNSTDLRSLISTCLTLSSPAATEFTEDSCDPLVLTSSTCEDLGWGNANKFGDFRVCGASKSGGCSGTVSWSEASNFCENSGTRLCTLVELQNDEARSTGCSLDSRFVWSSSACDGGHALAPGSSSNGKVVACEADSAENFARCCATIEGLVTLPPDEAPPMTSTCDDLGWTNAAKYGSSLVCGESDLGLGGCSGAMSWSEASNFCASAGARLCTSKELEGNEAAGTGCQYDSKMIWSSTPCPGGFSVAAGASYAQVDSGCASAEGNLNFARCCTGVDTEALNLNPISSATCADLGWTDAASYGSTAVCGESDLGLGGCSGEMSFVEAETFCTAIGARLCTLSEVESDETRGTGCGYDSKLVWTNSPCSGGAGHAQAPGASTFSLGAPCAKDSEKGFTRCCADSKA